MTGLPYVVAALREHASTALDHADHLCQTYWYELGAAIALYGVVGAEGYSPEDALGPALLARLETYGITGADAVTDQGMTMTVEPYTDDPEPIAVPTLPPITADEITGTDLDSLLWALVDSDPQSGTYHGTA